MQSPSVCRSVNTTLAGDIDRFTPHVRLDRIRDEALIVCFMVHGLMLCRQWPLLSGERDPRTQRHLRHRNFALSILAHDPARLIPITFDDKSLPGRDIQEPEHVAACQRRDQRLFRIDGLRDRKRQLHNMR